MSSATIDPPILAGARAAAAALADIAGLPTSACSQSDALAALDAVQEVLTRAAGLRAALVGDLDERGITMGTATVRAVSLLTDRYRLSRRTARQIVTDAQATRVCFPVVLQGQRDGLVSAEQAAKVIGGLDQLPGCTSLDDRDTAQHLLVGMAGQLDPAGLANAAHRIVERLTPVSEDGPEPSDGPDEHDRRYLHWHNQNGGVAGSFFLPGLHGEAFRQFLAKFGRPDNARYGDQTGRDRRTLTQRDADALAEAVQHRLDCGSTPQVSQPTAVVTMDLQWLTRQLLARGAGRNTSGSGGKGGSGGDGSSGSSGGKDCSGDVGATSAAFSGTARPARPTFTGSGQTLSATDARMAACADGIIPMVLGSKGEILDVGRASRYYPTGIGRAIAVRDQGCIFGGCDQPPAACHVHHLIRSWDDGGGTNSRTGALLCPHHHRQVHRQGWTGQLDTHGRPLLVPPAWIDPQQQPRQHDRFHRRQ